MKKEILFFALILFWACGPDPIPAPEPASLIAPANLNSCTTASPVNSLESQVKFQWTASLNTESYELVIQNQVSNRLIKKSTSLLNESVILSRGVPYSWYVNSKSLLTEEFGKSPVWVFYLEGETQKSSLPFPAVLLQTENEALVQRDSSGNFTFQWTGKDLDGDISRYDLYLGIDPEAMVLEKEGLSSSTASIKLNASTRYYWKIITHDTQKNQSTSLIFTFQTEE